MKFGEALDNLQYGHKAGRKGWNGKGQYVVLAFMEKCSLADSTIITSPRHDNIGDRFLMFVGTSGYQCGWLASQADMLADDWEVWD